MRRRSQSAVVGFVLMFGLVILLMTILQVSAVPTWNQGEEFTHSQQVRGELAELRDDVSRTAATGQVRSRSVSLGLRYPRRPFLLNPVDPSGRIQTTPQAQIRLENLTADGELGHYWNGTRRNFTTRHVRYRPEYNEYDNAPETILEPGVLYDRYEDRTRPLTAQSIVNGRRITLTTVNGSLSESGTTAETVELTPLSAPQQVTSLDGSGPVRIRLPSRVDEETWNDLLEDEFVANGGNVYDNVTVTEGNPYDTVTITLRGDRTYDLRLAAVGVGNRLSERGPHYLTTESPPAISVASGGSERVVFEVRDRYNNPVSGVTVNTSLTGSGDLTAVDPVTDDEGHAIFRYDATRSGSATVEATFGEAPGRLETATVSIAIAESGGTGSASGVRSSGACRFETWSTENRSVTISEADTGCSWPGLDGTTSLELSDARFSPLTESERLDADTEYLRTVFVTSRGDTSYLFLVSANSDGLARDTGGTWSGQTVEIYRKTGDQQYQPVTTANLRDDRLESLYQNTDSVDLLGPNNYERNPSGLAEVRNFLRDGEVELYLIDQHGRVQLTAD